MKYMTVLEAAQKWGVSDRRVRFLCAQGRIRGIIQQGRRYLIPDDTKKPDDERVRKSSQSRELSYNDFTRIDLLKNMAAEAPELSRQAEQDQYDHFVSRFACNSNALQGNTLSQSEVDEVLAGQVVYGHPLCEHMAVAGCRQAMDYASECAAEKKPLSQNIIKNIHSHVVLDDPSSRGKYRKVRVRIMGAQTSPVYLDLMEPRINDLLNLNTQRKKVMHPIERIARFYLEFLGIHPFESGNGRTARILMNLELMQSGFPPICIEASEAGEYREAMQAFLQDHKAEPMIKLVSEKVEASLENRLKVTRKKKGKKAETRTSRPAA